MNANSRALLAYTPSCKRLRLGHLELCVVLGGMVSGLAAMAVAFTDTQLCMGIRKKLVGEKLL